MTISPKQLEATIRLPGNKRYATFIKVAADQRRVWGLYSDGWALATMDDGKQAFPLWPASDYAIRCCSGGWQGYQPRQIDLDTFLKNLIPKLRASQTLAVVFPTPEDKGVTPDLGVLEDDLCRELGRIE